MCLQAQEIDYREHCGKEAFSFLDIPCRTDESKLVQNDMVPDLCSSYNSHDDKSKWQSMTSNQPEGTVPECATGWPSYSLMSGRGKMVCEPKVLRVDGKTQEQAGPDLWLACNQEQKDVQDAPQYTEGLGIVEVHENQQTAASKPSNSLPWENCDKNNGFLKSMVRDKYHDCLMACTKKTSETFFEPDFRSAFSIKPSSILDAIQPAAPSSRSPPVPSLVITEDIVYDNLLLPPLLPERAAFAPRPENASSCMRLAYRLPTLTMTSGKTILVTGGAGYIGTHAVIELIEAGYDIVVIDNLVNASMESIRRVEKIVGKQIPSYNVDLLNKAALEEVFKKHRISAVIHFAGLKAVGESCELPLLYYKTNVGGTTNLLEVMEANGVFNLVFSSSATVYGTPQFLPLTEEHPVGSCTNPYGKSKYMIEQILQDISTSNKKWNIVILRYFNPVGSHKSGCIGEDPQGVPNNLMPYIAQVAVGRREFLSVYGSDYDTPDGTGVRDYIHVVDLAQGHVAAVRKLDENCGLKIYNLGTGQGYSVLDMVKAFEKASGKQIAYKLVDRRPGDVASCYSDPSLAAKELGWTAKRGLDEMCEDLWRWQSQNPQGFNTPQN